MNVENNITLYYSSLTEIRKMEYKLDLLLNQKEEIKNDILTVGDNLQEKEKVMADLGEQLYNTNLEIIQLKFNKRNLQRINADYEFVIKNIINDEERNLLNLIYNKKETAMETTFSINIKSSKLQRKKSNIISIIENNLI